MNKTIFLSRLALLFVFQGTIGLLFPWVSFWMLFFLILYLVKWKGVFLCWLFDTMLSLRFYINFSSYLINIDWREFFDYIFTIKEPEINPLWEPTELEVMIVTSCSLVAICYLYYWLIKKMRNKARYILRQTRR